MSWMRGSRSASLALRLSAWYAGSAFLLLVVGTLRTLLARGDARMVLWEVEGEAGERVVSRVLDFRGKVLMEPEGGGPWPAVDRERPGVRDGEIFLGNGRYVRIVTQRAAGGGRDYTVQVALDVTFEHNLLAEYRRRSWAVLAAGLMASVLAGYAIARRGIRPVEEIARKVGGVRSTTLDQRIDMTGMPSELSALAATFNGMLDRLEDAFARLARFSSDIAHELRTPVNNLRGEIEVALGRARSVEEYRDVLGSSLEECLRLSRLIESLLFLARAENPRTEIRRERVEVARELATVKEFYEAAASECGISLALDAPPDLAANLDRTLFQRAVGNLVENALAYTPAGGTVRLTAERRNGNVEVAVSDTGCGIPAEHLDRVFDRFHRVDAARSQDRGGAGLGLAIVKSIAALHGGGAHIESTPGRGTLVRLAFPAGGG